MRENEPMSWLSLVLWIKMATERLLPMSKFKQLQLFLARAPKMQ